MSLLILLIKLEATGFDIMRAHITDIHVKALNLNGTTINEYRGKSTVRLGTWLRELWSRADTVLYVAHNGFQFGYPLLFRELERRNVHPRDFLEHAAKLALYGDTMVAWRAERLFREHGSFSLQSLSEHVYGQPDDASTLERLLLSNGSRPLSATLRTSKPLATLIEDFESRPSRLALGGTRIAAIGEPSDLIEQYEALRQRALGIALQLNRFAIVKVEAPTTTLVSPYFA
jgi:hypothetical protein